MPMSDRSSSDGKEQSPRPRRRSRSRSASHRRRSLSPDLFGPKLPKPRNREREREERDRRLREARNIKRFRIGSPRRSRSRSRERYNNHWSDQRDVNSRYGRDDYYDQQRDDAQRQRQEAFIARYLAFSLTFDLTKC